MLLAADDFEQVDDLCESKQITDNPYCWLSVSCLTDLDLLVANDSEADKIYLNDGSGVMVGSGQSLGMPELFLLSLVISLVMVILMPRLRTQVIGIKATVFM